MLCGVRCLERGDGGARPCAGLSVGKGPSEERAQKGPTLAADSGQYACTKSGERHAPYENKNMLFFLTENLILQEEAPHALVKRLVLPELGR